MCDARLHRLIIRLTCLCLATSAGLWKTDAAAPANDNFSRAVYLAGLSNDVFISNSDATAEPGEPLHADSPGGKSVWWSWQASFTGTMGVNTGGSTFDTLLAIYTGDSVSNLQVVADNDDTEGFGIVSSSLVFRALAGETYFIAVDGFNGATGTVRLTINPVGRPAPTWSLIDLNGQLIKSSDFRNRVLVIDFWETTCAACVNELPYLKQLHTNFLAEGFTMFGVSMDPATVDVRGFVQAHQVPYPMAKGNEEMDDVFGPNVPFPTKFLIDREGLLVAQHSVSDADYTYYAKAIKPLLRGSDKVPLAVRRENSAIAFTWPGTEFGYHLESNGALAGTNWTVVTAPILATNDQNTVTLPIDAGARFFRLRKTPLGTSQ